MRARHPLAAALAASCGSMKPDSRRRARIDSAHLELRSDDAAEKAQRDGHPIARFESLGRLHEHHVISRVREAKARVRIEGDALHRAHLDGALASDILVQSDLS